MPRDSTYPVRKLVNLSDEMAAQIADFRFDKRLPSENEAIRRLIELGLASARHGEKYAKNDG